jgi:diguanylate cyclase (GGDEF)-like protein
VADEFNRMIIQIHESERDLADLARRDKLTGAPNRRAFDEALSESFSRLERMNDLFALLVVDVDHFKRVNDTYGHAGGDQVLRAVWQALKSSLREIDKVFRIGGEEFAVLLPSTDQGSAKVTAARLCSVVAAHPIKAEGTSITVTISIGIALPSDSSTPEALMKEADTALYQAKAQGRNRFVINRANAA